MSTEDREFNVKADGYVDSIDDNEKVTHTPHEAYGTEFVKTRHRIRFRKEFWI